MAINIRKAKSQTAFTLLEIKSYNKETSKNDILDIFTTFFVNRGSFYLMFLVCTDAHVLEYPMLHTNFQRKRIVHVFTIYGHGGHLGHVTWTI